MELAPSRLEAFGGAREVELAAFVVIDSCLEYCPRRCKLSRYVVVVASSQSRWPFSSCRVVMVFDGRRTSSIVLLQLLLFSSGWQHGMESRGWN
jgi:hypothetical protein